MQQKLYTFTLKSTAYNTMNTLLTEVRACTVCIKHLPLPPKPILQASAHSKLLIIGQAPGIKAHEQGIVFKDASGKRLREWLGIDEDTFYDAEKVAIMPMGFCYPGKGKSGDLPPRPECAPLWHHQLLAQMKQVQLTLYIGQYAQKYYLKDNYSTLTERVKNWRSMPNNQLVLPHPSPRNRPWLAKNLWFEQELIPDLQKRVQALW